MPRAKLAVDLPPSTWIHDVSTADPATTFHVTTVLPADERGVVLVELETADLVPLVAAMDARDDVLAVDVLWRRGDEALLQVETSDPELLGPVREAGVPLETPFAVADGRASWELTTSRERLSALRASLADAGVAFTLESVGGIDRDGSERLLTDRQEEVLLAARAAGYYDEPRTATLTDVAEALGVSAATVSDVLHRAEGRLVERYAAERDDAR